MPWTLGWVIKAFESSIVGSSIQPIISFGAPAWTAASKTTFAASTVDFLARGCGEKMMAFRVLRQISDLKMAVEVGLVVGTMPAKTPSGAATILMPLALSELITPQVLTPLCLLYMYSEAKWFLMILSSKIPMPVSSTAIWAKSIRFLLAAMAAALKMASTFSSGKAANWFWATWTRSTSSSKSCRVFMFVIGGNPFGFDVSIKHFQICISGNNSTAHFMFFSRL